jgi:preprotein translocase subunit SecA
MEHLKSSVSLQAYGQKDPVVEYKKEARKHFDGIYADILGKIKSTIVSFDPEYFKKTMDVKSRIEKQAELAIANSGKREDGKTKGKTLVKNKEDEVGRNETCPCGSGKKYKKCHGKK